MPLATIDAIKRVAPNAKNNYLESIEEGGSLFLANGITTPLRMAHFLAQALHETGGFSILRENMNYKASRLIEIFGVGRHSAAITGAEAAELAGKPEVIAERVYGLGNPHKARELGNLSPGDGFRYRGNGILQTTGRGSHKQTGLACGVDFEGNPDLVVAPEHALKPALHEWTSKNLNLFADRNDIRTITKKINGGFNGLQDRQARFNKIWPLLKNDDQPDDASRAGAEDDDVKSLQEKLNILGSNPKLVVDGRYGAATREAVRDFQAIAGLTRDGIAGPVTLAAIQLRLDAIRGI